MKGYFKGELRACPRCGKSAIQRYDNCIYCSDNGCGTEMDWGHYEGHNEETSKKCRDNMREVWNIRPAFDEAIDGLISIQILAETPYNTEISETYYKLKVEELTGLAWPEALEIYKERTNRG